MRLWPFQKAVPERLPTDAPVQPQVLYLNSGIGVNVVKMTDYVNAEMALRHPIVYRALNKLSESVQQVRWFVEVDPNATLVEQRGNQERIKRIQSLLDSPNGEMTPSMLRYWMTLNFAVYGRIPVKVSHSAMRPDEANGIYPLEARFVKAVANRRGVVERYIYGEGSSEEVYPSRQMWNEDISKGFVDQIWKPALRGYQHKDEVNTPLMAVGLPATVIQALLRRAIRSAEGHPNVRYLVTCSKTLTVPQLDALRTHLNKEMDSSGELSGTVPVLQNAGELQIHKLDNDLSDIHSKMPSDDMARLIFGAFGIPIALAGMGAADGAKFAGNYVESRLAFWQDTIIPGYVEPVFQGLTRMLCPVGIRISPDLDSIPALMAGRILSMKEVNSVAFLTVNEKRELFGFESTEELENQGKETPTATNEDEETGNEPAPNED